MLINFSRDQLKITHLSNTNFNHYYLDLYYLIMGIINEIQEKLLTAAKFIQYQNCWISDIAWQDILKHNLGYDVSKRNLNKAFNSLSLITPGWKVDKNDRNFKNVKNVPRVVSFYYVNTGTIANRNYSTQQWLDIFNFHRLTRLIINHQKTVSDEQGTKQIFNHIDKRFSQSISCAPKNNEETRTSQVNVSSDLITQQPNSHISVGTYFDSLEANKLFNPFGNETVEDCILRRIKILSSIIEKDGGIKEYVNYADQYPLTQQQVQNLTHQCVILRACYYNALRNMATVQNWGQIITNTLNCMSECGIKTD